MISKPDLEVKEEIKSTAIGWNLNLKNDNKEEKKNKFDKKAETMTMKEENRNIVSKKEISHDRKQDNEVSKLF